MPNDIPNSTWNEADASNTSPVPNGAPEGWFPSDVNNVYRMGMGATKRFWDHLNFTETSTGTSTAIVLTYPVAPEQLWDGEIYSFIVGTTCGNAPTLNVNALGAKGIRKFVGTAWVAITSGEMVADQKIAVAYNLTDQKFDIVFKASNDGASLSGNNAFTGTNSFADTVTMLGAAFNGAIRVDVASASTCNIGAADSNYIRITGTTTINAFDTVASGVKRDLYFPAVLTLTHSSALVLPNDGDNIATGVGDTATFISDAGGNWRCLSYQRRDGTALQVFPGTIVGRAYAQNTSFTTVTDNIPAGNIVPQITEGEQILSAAITPKATGNRVRATVKVPIGLPLATTGVAVAALFRNGATNALDSTIIHPLDGSGTYPAVLIFEDSPGSISAQTYTVRVGGGTGTNIVVNGDSSGALSGGTSRAALVLEEIAA